MVAGRLLNSWNAKAAPARNTPAPKRVAVRATFLWAFDIGIEPLESDAPITVRTSDRDVLALIRGACTVAPRSLAHVPLGVPPRVSELQFGALVIGDWVSSHKANDGVGVD